MDATITRRLDALSWFRHLPPRTLIIASALAVAGAVPRWLWDQFLDTFEDGYHNWWIATILAETGRFTDPFSGMTRGNWLPGYQFLLAGAELALGSHIMPFLKTANIAFALGTAAVVYFLALPRGKPVALLASALFLLNPIDVVISSYAIPEALNLLLVFGGILVLERRPLGEARSRAIASVAFLVAATLRYETWGFVALYVGWKWHLGELSPRQVLTLLAPAAAFAAIWAVWTSQFGFLPAIIVSQTSTDVLYKGTIGALAPPWVRVASFFGFYFYWMPLAVVGLGWALKRELRSPLTIVLFAFYAAEVAYTAVGYGNPSPRYIHLTVPIATIYASTFLVRAGTWLRNARPRWRAWTSSLPSVAAIALSVGLVVLVVTPVPPPGTLLTGMQRAGVYLSSHPLPAGKLLVSESPIAAYFSGYPADRIIGSTFLPGNATNASAYLVATAAYVVMVTVPYYKLRTLFPEQANGTDGNHLVLLYDATGAEYYLGAPRVLVFEVVP